MKKVAFYTLGCKVNQYETEAMLEMFKKEGYTQVDSEDFADVYVINNCTVTHMSDRKSRQYIRRMKNLQYRRKSTQTIRNHLHPSVNHRRQEWKIIHFYGC